MANQYKSLLHAIKEDASADEVAEMIKNGVDTQSLTEALEHIVKCNKDSSLAKMMIDAGANVYVRDSYGDTLLHVAVRNLNIEIAKVLIDAGADVNDTNNEGESPLMAKFQLQDTAVEISKLLVEAGADIYLKDNSGQNKIQQLFECYGWGEKEEWDTVNNLISLYLQQGWDIDDKNDNGNTTILECCFGEVFGLVSEDVINFMVIRGSNVNITSEQDGLSLLDHVNNGDIEDKEVCELILKAANK